MVSPWKHFQHWGIFILQFLSCLGLCYDCEAKVLYSVPENLLWWFKERLKCSLVVSQSLGITFGMSDVGTVGKMKITQQGLVLFYASGLQSEFGSSGIHILHPLEGILAGILVQSQKLIV